MLPPGNPGAGRPSLHLWIWIPICRRSGARKNKQKHYTYFEDLIIAQFILHGMQRLVLEKVCLVDLGLNGTICSNHSGVQEVEVQRRSNLIFTAWYALCIVPGLILCVFLGPWSDENGRKPLLVLPLLGYVVSYIYLILYAAW